MQQNQHCGLAVVGKQHACHHGEHRFGSPRGGGGPPDDGGAPPDDGQFTPNAARISSRREALNCGRLCLRRLRPEGRTGRPCGGLPQCQQAGRRRVGPRVRSTVRQSVPVAAIGAIGPDPAVLEHSCSCIDQRRSSRFFIAAVQSAPSGGNQGVLLQTGAQPGFLPGGCGQRPGAIQWRLHGGG